MCTAISYKTKTHYFGRNLDMEFSYEESVVIMPQNFPFLFRYAERPAKCLSLIGTAIIRDNIPLFYDATNEKGLSMAGLSFKGNAVFTDLCEDKTNIAPFELIPWILTQCENVNEARELIEKTNIAHIDFSKQLPVAELHWLISDEKESIVLECTKDGTMLYNNPTGVLTNNPPFPIQLFSLNNYMSLSNQPPVNTLCQSIGLDEYSRGMGAIGLPGDLSSSSRFVRAVFHKTNSVYQNSENKRVNQFFHILSSVSQLRGAVQLKGGKYEYTVYSSCCNTKKGIYYYTTYDNSSISAVDMRKENLKGDTLYVYPMITEKQFTFVNNKSDLPSA